METLDSIRKDACNDEFYKDEFMDLRIGVIGSGGRGAIAAYAHHPGEGSCIVACCSPAPETLEHNRETYGADIFTTGDYRALLRENLDAVSCARPIFCTKKWPWPHLNLGWRFTSKSRWRLQLKAVTAS